MCSPSGKSAAMVLIYVFMFTPIAMVTATQSTCSLMRYTGSFHEDDHVNDHALVGFSYKNVTVSNIQQCFGVCVMDCRCLSYQVSGTRCEVMDEDRRTVPKEKLVSIPGYKYFGLKQKFKNSIADCGGKCRNSCCRFITCLNGGTCVETCDNVKRKFKCKCPLGYIGGFCQIYRPSCAEYAKHGKPSGYYRIVTPSGQRFKAYCDLTSEPGIAWTLIESFAFQHSKTFQDKTFLTDFPVNQDSPQWENFRLSRNHMLYVKENAELWRATCRYDIDGFQEVDYIKGLLSKLDILTYNDESICAAVQYVNIRNQSCSDCRTHFHQSPTRHPYADSYLGETMNCGWSAKTGAVLDSNINGYDDNFGFYLVHNPKHRCVSSSSSTTQWWLGSVITY